MGIGGSIGSFLGGGAGMVAGPVGWAAGSKYGNSIGNWIESGGKGGMPNMFSMGGGGQLNLPELEKYHNSKYQDYLDKFAMSKGPSEQANYLTQQAGNIASQNLGQMKSGNLGSMNTGLSNLAMRGGLQSGARERLAGQMNRQNALGQQSIYGGLANQKLGILANDEANKFNTLGNLQQMYDQQYANRLQADAARQGAQMNWQTSNKPSLSNFWGLV